MSDVPLREYIESKIEALDAKTSERYPSKKEYLDNLSKIQDDIRQLREYRALMDGKASQNSVILAYVISAIGLICGIMGIFVGLMK